MCNRQVVFKIKPLAPLSAKELCWQIRGHLTTAHTPIHVLGREVYAVVEPSPSRRDRNRRIGVASRVLFSRLANPETVIVDFRAGAVYFKRGEAVNTFLELGRRHPKKKWVWDMGRVNEMARALNIETDFADLDSETASALADE